MAGTWRVKLEDATMKGDSLLSDLLVDTKQSISQGTGQTGVGDQVIMYVPTSFAQPNSVRISVTGRAVSPPTTLYDSADVKARLGESSLPRDASVLVTRANFDKTDVYNVTQKTKDIAFKISQATSGGKSKTDVEGDTDGFELGGGLSGGEGVTVNVAGKFMNSHAKQTQKTDSVTNTDTTEVSFTGKIPDAASELAITPVL
jgi:hypothetical protein